MPPESKLSESPISFPLNLAAGGDAAAEALPLETPTMRQRAGYFVTNPFKNFLLPSRWLKQMLEGSSSPLLTESFQRPGGWRSQELIYRNDPPVDWMDRQALRDNPISMASRNRCRIITNKLAGLITRYASQGPVSLLGVGAGPGRHVQTAIVKSGIVTSQVRAYLIDLDDDAFGYGQALAARLGIADCVQFLKGDARQIRETLPDVRVQIVKLVGIVEYLSDLQLLEMLDTLRGVMTPDATLVTHGLVDAHGMRWFLKRVFGLRHHRRTANHMARLLTEAGFPDAECIVEPVRVYPIMTATRAA